MFSRLFHWLFGKTRGVQLETVLDGMRVRDLMNRDVRTARPQMSVSELMELMLREHHLGFPVVDDGGEVVGMVSLHDVRAKLGDMRIEKLMRREVPTVQETAPASEALHLMAEEGFNRVVAADRGGILRGSSLRRT
jgi:CBS domain-containing protein